MSGAKHRVFDRREQGLCLVVLGEDVSFALSSGQANSCQCNPGQSKDTHSEPLPARVAKARRANRAFGRRAAHLSGLRVARLPDGVAPASWRGEQPSPREGVSSCGQSYTPLRWDFLQPCQPVATPQGNKWPLAPGQAPLAQLCWEGICSLGLRSAQRPILSTARKTQVVARATPAPVSLICQPNRATADIHANAASAPRARLRRFAFRHTKEQGTANV